MDMNGNENPNLPSYDIIQIRRVSSGDKIAWLCMYFSDIALASRQPASAVGYEVDIIQHFMGIGGELM